MKKKYAFFCIVVFFVVLFSCTLHVNNPVVTDSTTKTTVSVSFKIPHNISPERSNLPITERFIHPQTHKITLVITEGETEIINTSKVIEEQSQTATFVLENIPLGKSLKLVVKAFDAKEMLVASGEKNFTLEEGQTSLSITLLPDGAEVLDLDDGYYFYEFSQFQKDSYYMFLIENMPKGIYNFIWLSKPEDEFFDGYDVPEVYILNENGNKHGEGSLFPIETGSQDDKFQWNFFGTTEDQDIYLFIKGKNLEDDEFPSFEIWPYDGSVAVAGTVESNEYIELTENGAEINFGASGPSTKTFTIYNPYERSITIDTIKINHNTDSPKARFTIKGDNLENTTIAPGSSKPFSVQFDIDGDEIFVKDATCTISFTNGLAPFTLTLSSTLVEEEFYTLTYDEDIEGYLPDDLDSDDVQETYVFKIDGLEVGAYIIDGTGLPEDIQFDLYGEDKKHIETISPISINLNEEEVPHYYFRNNMAQTMYLIIKDYPIGDDSEPPYFEVYPYEGSVIVVEYLDYQGVPVKDYKIINEAEVIDFGQVTKNYPEEITFSLYNPYGIPIILKSFEITGEDLVEEEYTTDPIPMNDVIPPKGKYVFDIIFDPKADGNRKGKIEFKFEGKESFSFNLSGTTCGF